jgi:hypothetical protein
MTQPRETSRGRHEKPGDIERLIDDYAAMLAARLTRILTALPTDDPSHLPPRRLKDLHIDEPRSTDGNLKP